MKALGFHDLFLFDERGNLIYSHLKEVDFGTNLLSGPHAASGLGAAYRAARASDAQSTSIVDFDNYEPSYLEPAAFLAMPVFRGEHRIGVVALQINIEKLNNAVADVHGLGETGETYIIGGDLLMRSDSRFEEASSILRQRVATAAAKEVVRGRSGSILCEDYRGVEVLSHYRPLEIDGLSWGMIAEVDQATLSAPATRLTLATMGILIATLSLIALVSLITVRLCVTRPLQQLVTASANFMAGNYHARVNLCTEDEFGELATSHNAMATVVQTHITRLETSLSEIKQLQGLLPICSACKSIRDDDGYFKTVETYLVGRSALQFSHTICQDCVPRLYPELDQK